MAGETMSAFVRFFVKDEVSGEASKVEQSALKASDGMDKAADSAGKRLKDGLEKAKGAAANVAKGLGALSAAAGGVVAAALKLAGEETANYTQGCNMLKVSAEAVGVSQEEANKAYQNFLGLTGDGDQATEAAQDMLNLAQAGGDIDTWYDIAAGTVARFGDALPVENLIESANETIRTGQIVGSMADAVNWASASAEDWKAALGGNKAALAAFQRETANGASAEDAFNAALAACSSESERAQITQAALNQIYGKTGKAFQETNKDIIEQRKAQDDWNAAVAKAAEAVRPFTTAIMELGAEFVGAATPYIEEFGRIVSDQVKPALENMASAVLPPIKSAFGWLRDNLPTIAPIVVGIATAFGAFKAVTAVVNGVKGAMTAWKLATDGLKLSQVALNLVMSANPFVLVAALIAGLVAAFVVLWNTNEGFRNAVISAWNAIKSAASSVFGWLGGFLSGVWDGIKSAASAVWSGIKSVITGAASAIKTGVVSYINALKTTWSAVFNAIKTVASTVWNGIKTVVLSVANAIKSGVENIVNGIKSAVSSVWNGIKAVSSSVWNGIKTVVLGVANALKSGVATVWNGIKSTTSSVFNGIKSVASSVWNGIKTAISTPINAARDAVSKAIDAIKGFFNFKVSWPHIPMPHFSISPSGWKVGDLLKGSIPKLGIDWYAKAMDNAMILDRPTIFGAAGGNLLGGGEAGSEVVSGTGTLMSMIRDAVRDAMGGSGGGYVANINVTTGETDEAKLARMIAREQKRSAYALGAL